MGQICLVGTKRNESESKQQSGMCLLDGGFIAESS
jgi:hypothetical protein